MADAALTPQTSKDFNLKELVIVIVALQICLFAENYLQVFHKIWQRSCISKINKGLNFIPLLLRNK